MSSRVVGDGSGLIGVGTFSTAASLQVDMIRAVSIGATTSRLNWFLGIISSPAFVVSLESRCAMERVIRALKE